MVPFFQPVSNHLMSEENLLLKCPLNPTLVYPLSQTNTAFKKGKLGDGASVFIGGTVVERVSSIKFLGVNISDHLSWAQNIDVIIKLVCQCLYFIRSLKRFGLLPKSLRTYRKYPVVVKALYDNSNAQERRRLQRVVD